MSIKESKRTIIKGAKIFADGEFANQELLIEDGKVSEISLHVTARGDEEVVELSGMRVVPGFVDVHVHLREPGFSYKETIESGTKAAAKGGYTTICSMPNLKPAPDSVATLSEQLAIIERDAVINVLPYATITMGQQGFGETVDFDSMKDMVAGFSDDGRGVQEDETMLKAMEQVAETDKVLAAHCEVNALLNGGYIHDGKYAAKHGHKGISSESEWAEVQRDVAMAQQTGCRFHVCHMSTKESVAIVRQAKQKGAGAKITAETAPHYLVLCDEDLQEDGRFKMNPPLRARADQDALLEGIVDGTIEVIATDHAPHSAEEKARGLSQSAMGIVGLETAFPVLYTALVRSGIISMRKLVELMSTNPRRIFGISGGLKVGEAADLAVLDLDCQYTISSDDFVSMGKSTPFDGMSVWGRNIMTFVGGEVVYKAEK